MEYLTLTEAREQLTKLERKLNRTKKGSVIITRHGKPLFRLTLLRKRKSEIDRETEEILADPEAMAAIRAFEKEYPNGKYHTLEEVEKKLGL